MSLKEGKCMSITIEIDDDWDYENFKLIYPKVLKTRYTGQVIDDTMKKEYKFTYITEERVVNPGNPLLKWRDKSEVPRIIRERALSNVQNLVNAIIKKESK